jgi:hypothetical protein
MLQYFIWLLATCFYDVIFVSIYLYYLFLCFLDEIRKILFAFLLHLVSAIHLLWILHRWNKQIPSI